MNRWHMDKRKSQRSLPLIQPEGFFVNLNCGDNIMFYYGRKKALAKSGNLPKVRCKGLATDLLKYIGSFAIK